MARDRPVSTWLNHGLGPQGRGRRSSSSSPRWRKATASSKNAPSIARPPVRQPPRRPHLARGETAHRPAQTARRRADRPAGRPRHTSRTSSTPRVCGCTIGDQHRVDVSPARGWRIIRPRATWTAVHHEIPADTHVINGWSETPWRIPQFAAGGGQAFRARAAPVPQRSTRILPPCNWPRSARTWTYALGVAVDVSGGGDVSRPRWPSCTSEARRAGGGGGVDPDLLFDPVPR